MVLILELVGTVAFAISGAAVGVQKKMDVLGVMILAMTTAVGGGIIRDVILNVTPPAAFRTPVYALSALAVGLVVFILEAGRLFREKPRIYETVLLWMDALGLGLFTVSGMRVAYSALPDANAFLAVFVGVVTGVGGGVLRDVMSGSVPYIFVKDFYATASLAGAIVCALAWNRLGALPSMVTGACLIVLLRLLAVRFRWRLPRIGK
jgi:uncharacterized membrane protein YeiH